MTPKTPKKHKQRFEHKLLSIRLWSDALESLMNYEKEGYELISIEPIIIDREIEWYKLFFKRPV